MTENIPIKKIPVPDYNHYKIDLCDRYSVVLPLKGVPFSLSGNLEEIPAPINQKKKGWPWTIESGVKFFDKNTCPKISVIVPSFRQGMFIEETIRSVVLQNYPNVELIIIDGGSDDETQHVIEHYKDVISIAVIEQDRGQSHAINKGFSIASGELFYWLNSDDYLNVNSFNQIIPYFIKNQKLDIVYGHGLLIEDTSDDIKLDYAPLVLERYLRFGGIVLSHSVIWRKRVHCPIWENLHCAMDAELWLRLFKGKTHKHSQFPIGVFRKHPLQKTSTSSVWTKMWKEDYENYIWKYYPPISRIAWQVRKFEYFLVQKTYHLFHPVSNIK